ASQVRGPSDKIQALEGITGCQKVQLLIKPQLASAHWLVDNGKMENELLLQAVYKNGTGKLVKTKVVRQQIVAEAPKDKPVANLGAKDGHTPILGGGADPEFKDQAPDGGVLIGFKVGLGKFFNNDIIAAIQPIYQTAKGEVLGKQYGTNFARLVT